MTGEQLKNVRTGKGMTRAAFATWLGGTTASTLNKWERGISAVPEWVDRRIASPDELVLPIDLIGELMADAEAHKIAPVKSLAEALRVGLAGWRFHRISETLIFAKTLKFVNKQNLQF